MSLATAKQALGAAVREMGGQVRSGQETMLEEICSALEVPEHLLVQAGTGTGKSLGYLIPLMDFAVSREERVLVSTATLNLQHQILTKDAPVAAGAIEDVHGRRPRVALLKGWNNYLCTFRLGGGYPLEGTLFDVPTQRDDDDEAAPASELGAEIVRLRRWASQTETGDRDELDPGVSDRAWSQVSVSRLECLGKQCPMIDDCFPQAARETAQEADVVVTNHSLLGISALSDNDLFGPIGALAVDEAHELAERVREQASVAVSLKSMTRISRRLRSLASVDTDALDHVAAQLDALLQSFQVGLMTDRTSLKPVMSALDTAKRDLDTQISTLQLEAATKVLVRAFSDELDEVLQAWGRDAEKSVTWVERDKDRGLSSLMIAPLHVAPSLADNAFGQRPAILTSATLSLGGSFDSLAYSTGLNLAPLPWRGVDVGSPFDASRQGILYIAAGLPAPSNGQPSPAAMEQMVSLVKASGGGALVLYASWAAARQGAQKLRDEGVSEVLLQGEDSLPALIKRFRSKRDSVLVGTMSLWQGVDVVGDSCRLVVIDKIPFPHPKNPIVKALTEDADRQGGKGFFQVSVTRAALMMAQGAGRLLRSHKDRGVVAVLDSRLQSRSYGRFIIQSMPEFWRTCDLDVVTGALERLHAELHED